MVGNKSSAGKIEDVDEVEKYQLLGFRTQECQKRLVREVEGEFEGERMTRTVSPCKCGVPYVRTYTCMQSRTGAHWESCAVAALVVGHEPSCPTLPDSGFGGLANKINLVHDTLKPWPLVQIWTT